MHCSTEINHPSQIFSLFDAAVLMSICTAFYAVGDRFCIDSLITDQDWRLLQYLYSTVPQLTIFFFFVADFTCIYPRIIVWRIIFSKNGTNRMKNIVHWNIHVPIHSQRVNNSRNSCFLQETHSCRSIHCVVKRIFAHIAQKVLKNYV